MNWYPSSNIASLLSAITRGGLLQIPWDPLVIRPIMDTAYPINLWQSEKANRPDILIFFTNVQTLKAYSKCMFNFLVPILSMQAKFGTPTKLVKSTPWRMIVQKFALRMCGKHWDSSYDDLLQLFSLPSLQQRRLYLLKIVHGLFYFPSGVFVEQAPTVKSQ